MTDATSPDSFSFVAPGRRSNLIDTVRALALLGVIIMNVGAMTMRFAGREVMTGAGPIDFTLMAVDLILVQGKARAVFAFLFGLGFALMMARASAKGSDFTTVYVRRMIALFAFGIVNQAFLFWGDILCLYAALGLVLLAFRNASDRTLAAIGLALTLLPPLLLGLSEAMFGHPISPLVQTDPSIEAARGLAAMTSPHYLDFVRFSASQAIERRLTDTAHMLVYDLGVFGLFLLGTWTVRSGIVSDLGQHRSLLRRILLVCLPLGFLLGIVSASRLAGIQAPGLLYGVVTAASAGIPIMAFGYLAAAALLLSRGFASFKALLAPAGRMALTNYLLSGAIGCWISYGYGLGMLGKYGIAEINLLALLLFSILLLFSHLWLSRFGLGPLEWLWRAVAYGRVAPAIPIMQ